MYYCVLSQMAPARGPGRKPGASLYGRKRLSLSISLLLSLYLSESNGILSQLMGESERERETFPRV